jgi:hypothetical protein
MLASFPLTVTDAVLEMGLCGFGLHAPRPATASTAAAAATIRLRTGDLDPP